MHGTFNGLSLPNISGLKVTKEPSGITRTSFRVVSAPLAKLDEVLQLKGEALLILSSDVIEGRIVQYSADVHVGYEITIESKNKGRSR